MTTETDNVSHAIIAGVNKCGTTSVFRYLSDHPDVCASNVKETRFFVRFPDGSESLTYENYLTHFQHRDQEPVLLEASPTYFSSGKIVGARINEILPGSRIVVLLRDPITKFFSYYGLLWCMTTSRQSCCKVCPSTSSWILPLTHVGRSEVSDPRGREFSKMLRQGRYFDHIQTFASQFPASRLRFFFFEDLVDDPKSVMKEVCRFLDLDDNFFDNYVFRVENKTRTYRSIALQKFVFRANMRLEKVLNRFPGLRKSAQSLYRAINERRQTDTPQIGSEIVRQALRVLPRQCCRASFLFGWILRYQQLSGLDC